MALDTVIVNDGTSDFTYVLMSTNASEAIYRDDSSTLSNPRTLRVSHQIAKEDTGVDRHLIQLSRTDDDADGLPYTGTAHAVLAVPRDGVTQADFIKEWNKLKDVVDDYMTALLGGFYPG